MAFTPEEIAQMNTTVSEGGDIAQLEFVKPLLDAGLELRTQGQLQALEQQHYQNGVNTRTRELYEEIERDIEGLSGLQKNGREKAYDYLKRALEHSAKSSQANDETVNKLNAQIKQLQAEKGIPTDEYNAKVQALTDAKTKAEKALEDTLAGYAVETERRDKEAVINGIVAGFKRSASVPERFFTTAVKDVTNTIMSEYGIKEMDGEQFLTKDGQLVVQNSSTVKLADYLRAQLKDGLEVGGGTGTNGNNGQSMVMHGIELGNKSIGQVRTELTANKIVDGSPHYRDIMTAWYKLNKGNA